jgi:hypothetical protein
MTKKPGWITAAEHMALLQQDPQWMARHQAQEAARMRRERGFRREQEDLLADLKSAGFQVESVWDFVNTAEKYPNAIPILLRHLTLPYSKRTKEGIVRALTVDYAGREVLAELIKQFHEQSDSSANSLKWVLGNAISQVARPSDAETVIGLAIDPAHGDSRDMITQRLPRVVRDKKRLLDVLRHLLSDKQTEPYARRAGRAQLY